MASRILFQFKSAKVTTSAASVCLTYIWFFVGTAQALSPGNLPRTPSYPQQYVATAWQTEQGLPQNSVYDIVQDQDGYLWLATWGGLVRFDGVRFRVFTSADIPGLGSGRVMSLCVARSGALWIGTRDGSLIRLEHGRATTFTEGNGLPGKFVSSIREDTSGRIWINTSGGIAHFTGTTLQSDASFAGSPISEFYLQARDGSMWFQSGESVVRFAPNGSVSTFPTHKRSGLIVREARDGTVFIAFMALPRLVRYRDGVFSEVHLSAGGPPQLAGAFDNTRVLAMATDTDHELLLLTTTGFLKVVGGQITAIQPLPLPVNAGELPKAISLHVDREGNRWVGTLATGLFRFRPAPLTSYGKKEGLLDSIFFSVFQDREGRMWMGGMEALYWFDGHRFHRFPGLKDIRSITQTRDGDLWFGGSGGLYRWHNDVLSRFRINAPAVSSIVEDGQGTIWVLAPTYDQPGGLYRFRNGAFELVTPDVHKMVADREGGLWVAVPEGLRHLRGDHVETYRQNLSSVPDIRQDVTGTVWVAEYGGGLFRFRDGIFKPISTRDGLPNSFPDALVDDSGDLWVSSDRNVFRFKLSDLNDFADGRVSSVSPVMYGLGEGMKSAECNSGGPGAWRSSDGRIWFPTLRGVVAIDPNAGVRTPPPVLLEEGSANTLLLTREQETSVPASSDSFDFQFTAPTLSDPDGVRFRYRLDPFDKAWVDAGTRRSAHYTNLPPGRYTFHVIAANSFGVWNTKGDSIHFSLRPHYYQTNWFRALCAMFALLIVWAVYQFRMRQLQHQFEMTLDARVGERTRIARDLHDTLLQSFHGLLLRFQTVSQLLPSRPTEAKEKLEAAIQQAADAITEGRDAVQGLRDCTVQSNDLALAISTIGEELAVVSTSPRPRFHVAVEGEARNLHPIVRDEIYKIGSEALRNAFQHAEAQQIEVEIRYDRDHFRLRVRDNGKGIDPIVLSHHAKEGHFGLNGMRERATLIGGTFDIWSEIGAGTEIELRLPSGKAYATRVRSWLSLASSGKA